LADSAKDLAHILVIAQETSYMLSLIYCKTDEDFMISFPLLPGFDLVYVLLQLMLPVNDCSVRTCLQAANWSGNNLTWLDSSFRSSFAASAQVAISSLHPLLDSSTSCRDFFYLRAGDCCKHIKYSSITILIILYLCKNCKLYSSVYCHACGCLFFQVESFEATGYAFEIQQC